MTPKISCDANPGGTERQNSINQTSELLKRVTEKVRKLIKEKLTRIREDITKQIMKIITKKACRSFQRTLIKS